MPKERKSRKKARLRYRPLPLLSIAPLSGGIVPNSQVSICNSQIICEDKYTDFLIYDPCVINACNEPTK